VLFGWGLSEYAGAIALIVSELVTNAIRHGEGQVRLGVSRDSSHLHVQVRDDGPGRPVRRPVTTDDESGHGLELVDGLLREHDGTRGVREDDAGHGKTVHVSIRLADAQRRAP
jgi:two-component sensor histidine kinase